MIRNLTPDPVHLHAAGIDGQELIVTFEPEREAARLSPRPLGPFPVAHGTRTHQIELLSYEHTTGLPDPCPHTYLLVDLEIALAARGRADLLVPTHPVRDDAGVLLGYRHLTSPC